MDWIGVEIGQIAKIISGKNQKEVENPNGEYPIYGSGGVFGFADQYLCPPGTTVIGRKGTINNPIFVNEKFWNVDTAFGIHPCEYVLPKLLFYFCKGFNFNKLDKSTTIPSLAKRYLLQIGFPLIPLPEQRAIVARIEELFSELDHAIANLKSAQAKLEIYRQAVLKKAFEGGFGKMKNQIGLPEGWRFVNFKELILGSPQNGLYRPSSDYGSGTKILRIDGFYEGVILSDYDYKRVIIDKATIDKYRLELGDIVVNRVNSMSHLGKSGLVNKLNEETVFESNIMRIKINQGIANPNYVVHFISSRKGILELTKNAKQAVNQASINQTDVANAIIPLPPIEEQYLIVQEIESRLSVADKLGESIQNNLLKSESLRQSILKQAFEGKLLTEAELEACRKEADWEPAEKLLERIKKNKMAK